MNKHLLILLIILTHIGCNNKQDTIQYSSFKSNFTKDQAIILDEILASFNEFLVVNYPNQKTIGAKTKEYLLSHEKLSSKPIKNGKYYVVFDDNWIFNTLENYELLDRFEKSGLRLQFYIWGYERNDNPYEIQLDKWLEDSLQNDSYEFYTSDSAYNHISFLNHRLQEYDSSLFVNTDSKFVTLTKDALNDTIMNAYFDAYYEQDNMSPAVLLGGLIKYDDDELSNPIIQLLIFREIFYSQMQADIDLNKRP
jgi:hypothetical protein